MAGGCGTGPATKGAAGSGPGPGPAAVLLLRLPSLLPFFPGEPLGNRNLTK